MSGNVVAEYENLSIFVTNFNEKCLSLRKTIKKDSHEDVLKQN